MNILLFEENITKASPLYTMEKAFNKTGAKCTVIDPCKVSTKELIKLCISHQYAVYQGYAYAGPYLKRQLAICAFFGIKLIRNWAGTDALNLVTREHVRLDCLALDNLFHLNISLTHQGIIDELSSVGMSCTLLPKFIEIDLSVELASTFVKKGVLIYLPSDRRQFYGGDILDQLILEFDELHFYILTDSDTDYSKYGNVTSLGWVDQMETVWNKVGLLLRITEHDGFPRMILDAQRRKKYVIHNNKFPGVMYAKNDISDVKQRIREYLNFTEADFSAPKLVEEVADRDLPTTLRNILIKLTFDLKKWLYSIKLIVNSK